MKTVFLVAGRTGGPFFPLPAIKSNLKADNFIFIGTKNSFESKVCKQKNWKIFYLPEAKLGILTFSKASFFESTKNILNLISAFWNFCISLIISSYLIMKYRPVLIYTTGSFLSVPLCFSLKLLKFFKLVKTKLAVHQQDPLVGLANKLVVKESNLNSCVFQWTRKNFSGFKNSFVIPNPINLEPYLLSQEEQLLLLKRVNVDLYKFINSQHTQPLLFIFGGGSGSYDLNLWVKKNFETLLNSFKVIHLTGTLQKVGFEELYATNYFQAKIFIDEMVPTLALSDLIICRAGLASITELKVLKKPAFLVPLPHSHQELNAKLSAHLFPTLSQADSKTWLQTIHQKYPKYWKSPKKFKETVEIQNKLSNYYRSLNQLIS